MKTATETVYDKGWYENAELASFRNLVRGARRFLDVGASVGPYSKVAYFEMSEGDVMAVEGNPRTFRELEEHVARWQEREDKPEITVSCVNRAVSNEKGTVEFVMAKSVLLSRVSFGRDAADRSEEEGEKVKIETVTLDELVGDGEPPDLLKLDIEGYEYRALLGATRILSAKKTRFLIEVHPWGDPGLGKRPSDVFEFMMKNGYQFRRFHRHWLFEPGSATGFACLKQRTVAKVMNHPRLRRFLKKPALFLDKLKGEERPTSP